MAFSFCVEFGDYGVVRKVGSSVSGYLIGRYSYSVKKDNPMKRDMGLIRKVLICVENDESYLDIDGYDRDYLKYHALILIEAGLLDGEVRNYLENTSTIPSQVDITRLTWNGHEFLDNIRSEEVWAKIKSEFKDASVSTIVSVGKQLAENFAKNKIQSMLS